MAKHTQSEVQAMWYVIQTVTGKEKEAAGAIDRVLEKKSYQECFVIQQECVWRMEGRCLVHIEPMFPSYVFVETDTPDAFFFELKRVPKLTKLLGSDGMFWMVQKEEEELLRKMAGYDPEYIIRRSLVEVDSNGEIISAEGALKEYTGRIVKKRLRKRVVVIEIPFLERLKQVQLAVRLKEDEERD